MGFAIVLPTLALAGYISASLRVMRLSRSETWVERLFKRTAEQFPEFVAFISNAENATFVLVPAFLGIVLFLRWVRARKNARRSSFTLNYRDRDFLRKVEMPLFAGVNLLDQLRLADIAHASVCGGRGRCSTCRVIVDDGLDQICLLYTSPSPRDKRQSRMPSSA